MASATEGLVSREALCYPSRTTPFILEVPHLLLIVLSVSPSHRLHIYSFLHIHQTGFRLHLYCFVSSSLPKAVVRHRGSNMDQGTLTTPSWLTIPIFLLFPFALTYTATLCLSALGIRGTAIGEDPPPVPYCTAFVGNALALAFDTLGFLSSVVFVCPFLDLEEMAHVNIGKTLEMCQSALLWVPKRYTLFRELKTYKRSLVNLETSPQRL